MTRMSLKQTARAALVAATRAWTKRKDDTHLLEAQADAVAVAVIRHVLANFHGFWPNDVRHSIEQLLASYAAPSAESAEIDKRAVGLYNKFIVVRTDGKSEPGQKHDGCEYFVLDCTHDPFASGALQAYANQCRREYPLLADDITRLRMKIEGIEPGRETGICERCQMRLEVRLLQRVPGVRGGMADRCYACNPIEGKEAERAEIVEIRKAPLVHKGGQQ